MLPLGALSECEAGRRCLACDGIHELQGTLHRRQFRYELGGQGLSHCEGRMTLRPGSRWIVVVILGALAVGAGFRWMRRAGLAHEAVTSTKPRKLAPDFTLPQPGGQPLTLSSYRGKIVLLDFWATWCYPCREEIPHFVEFQQKYGVRGLQVIGVSMDDSPEPVPAFYQK